MADLVKNDQIVFVKGTLDRRRDPPELIVSRIIPLTQGPAELTRGVIVRLHKGLHQTEHLERLLRAFASAPAISTSISKSLAWNRFAAPFTRRAHPLRIRYDDQLVPDLEDVVGPGFVRLLGQRGATARLDGGTASALSPRTQASLAWNTLPTPDDELDDTDFDDV